MYIPGDSWLHRLPVGVKFLAVAIAGVGLSLWHVGWFGLSLVFLGLLTAYLTSVGPKAFGAQLYRLKFLILIIVIPQLVFRDLHTAAYNSGRILLVVLAASLLTLTTATSVLLDTLIRAMGPLRWLRIDPNKPALLFLLTITTIPTIGALRSSLVTSHRARGGRSFSPQAITTLLVLTMKHSDELSQALAARDLEA